MINYINKNLFSREFDYAKRHFSNLPAVHYFGSLIQRVNNLFTKSQSPTIIITPAPTSNELSAHLDAIADGRFNQLPDDDEPDEVPLNPLSLLNAIERRPCEATAVDVEPSSVNLTEVSFLQNRELIQYLPATFQRVISHLRAAFDVARECQQNIEAIAAKGEIDYPAAKEKLEQASTALSEKVAVLPEQTPLHVYLPISYGQNSFTHAGLVQLAKYLKPEEKGEDFESLKRYIRDKVHTHLAELNLQEQYGSVLEIFASAKAKILGNNPSWLRTNIVNLLQGDLSTLVSETAAAMSIPEGVIESFGNLPERLEHKLDELLTMAFQQMEGKLDILNQTAQAVLPEIVLDGLAEQKFFVAQQFVYLIIEKAGDSYTVTVYPSKRDPSFYIDQSRGFHSPLVYRGVKAAQLCPEFFYRAFTFQAFLKQQGVDCFTLQHVKEGLLDNFMRNPVGKENCCDRNFSDQSLEGLEYTLMRQALISTCDSSAAQFDKIIKAAAHHYKFRQFLAGWDYFHHHPSGDIEKMINWVRSMAEEMKQVEAEHLCPENEIRQKQETLLDAAKKLRRLKQIAKKDKKGPLPPSLNLPPELRKKVEDLCHSAHAVSTVETIRSLLIEFLGEDADVALDQVIQEFFLRKDEPLPTPEFAITNPFAHKLGFRSILGAEEIKTIGKRGGAFVGKVSPLSTLRLYAAICDFCNHTVLGTLLELVLKAVLAIFFPGMIVSTLLVKSLLDRALLHGQQFAYSLLPKHLANALFAFLSLYNEISGYLKKRIATIVARSAFRAFFNEYRLQFLHHLNEFRSKVTREGEIGYGITNPQQVSKVNTPEPVVDHVPEPAAAEEAPQYIPDIEDDTFDSIETLEDLAHATHQLNCMIQSNERSGAMDPDELIAYFKTISAAYKMAKNRKLPTPNYLFLESWMAGNRHQLSDHQVEKIEGILRFARKHVPADVGPWNEGEIVSTIMERNCESTDNYFYEPSDNTTPLRRIMPNSPRYKKLKNAFSMRSDQNPLRMAEYHYLRLAYLGESLILNSEFKPFFGLVVFGENNFERMLDDIVAFRVKRRDRLEINEILKFENYVSNAIYIRGKEPADIAVNEFIRKLPIPQHGQIDIWDRIENPERIIQKLYALLTYLKVCQMDLDTIISIHVLYVISFHLAKRIPECHIEPSIQISGFEFIYFFSKIRNRFAEVRFGGSVRQAMELLEYFKAAPSIRSGIYDADGLLQKRILKIGRIVEHTTRFTLSHPRNIPSLHRDGSCKYVYFDHSSRELDKNTADYYLQLSHEPEIKKALEQIPIRRITGFWGPLFNVTEPPSTSERIKTVAPLEPYKHVPKEARPLIAGNPFSNRNIFHLYTDKMLPGGGSALPPAVRYLREMEYAALSTHKPNERFLEVDNTFCGSLIDMTDQQLNENSFWTRGFNAINHSVHNVAYTGGVLTHTRTAYEPIFDAQVKRVAVEHPPKERKVEEATKYRGEEFLRRLEFVRDNKQFCKMAVHVDSFLTDFISLHIILDLNPGMIHIIVREMWALIEDPIFETSKIKLIRLLLRICRFASVSGSSHLQNIRSLVREKLLSGELSDWSPLIESYGGDENICFSSRPEEIQALLDIAMGYRKKVSEGAMEIFGYWKSYLSYRLNSDPELVETVMGRLLNGYAHPWDIQGDWSGQYPVFSNGRLCINLESLPQEKIIDDSNELPLPSDDDEEDDFSNPIESDEMEIDLTATTHSLSLLSWFQPLNKITAFANRAAPDRLSRIVFPEAGALAFKIEEVDSEIRAYSEGNFPGFFIAPRQKIASLIPYSRYLLLENDRGEQRVILLPMALSQLSIALVAKTALDISMTAGIAQWIPDMGKIAVEPIACAIGAEGNLVPDTPAGVAYLFAFHYAQGDYELSFKYLNALRHIAKKGPLDETAFTFLEMMTLPLLCTMSVTASKMGCIVGSIVYENDLLYSNNRGLESKPIHSRICLWLMAQKAYLELKKSKTTIPLNEISELHFLRGISLDSQNLLGKYSSETIESAMRWMRISSPLDGILMHPTLTRRLAKLRKRYLDADKTTLQYLATTYLTDPITSSSQQPHMFSMGQTSQPQQERGVLMNIVDGVRAVRRYAIDPDSTKLKTALFEALTAFNPIEDLVNAPTTFSSIQAQDFQRYFIMYICLLVGENCGDNNELFDRKSTEFRKHLRLLQGNYNSDIRPFVDMLLILNRSRDLLNGFKFYKNAPKKTTLIQEFHLVLRKLPSTGTAGKVEHLQGPLNHFLTTFYQESVKKRVSEALLNRGVFETIKALYTTTVQNYAPMVSQQYHLQHALDMAENLPSWGVKQLHRLIKFAGKGEVPPCAEARDCAEDLVRRDAAVDAVFDYLLARYYQVVSPQEPEGETEIPPLELSDETVAGVAFEELYQSHIDYHNRPKEQKPTVQFIGNQEELKKEIEEIKEKTYARIRAEKEKIVAFANASGRAAAKNPQTLEEHFEEYVDITFDEIFFHIIKGEDAELCKKTGLVPERLDHLKLLVNLYLVACGRWETLFRAAKEGSIERLGNALLTRRAYGFTGKNPRIVMGLLAFEARTGLVLWKKQAAMFEQMLSSRYQRQVLELIMGSGKTAFGMPFINFFRSNKKRFVINIWPKATAVTNIAELSEQIKSVFGMTAWAFQFNRNRKVTPAALEAFYATLIGALKYSEAINMTKEDLQAIELNFIDLLNTLVTKQMEKQSITVEEYQNVTLYMKILAFIRKYGAGNIDEAHINFEQKIELNFPVGKLKRLPKKYNSILEKVFTWLMAVDDPALIPFKTRGMVQHKIDKEYFRIQISPQVYQQVYVNFDIAPENREQFFAYLRGDIADPDFVVKHKHYGQISLVKGALSMYLPMAFNSIPYVEFTLNRDGDMKFVQPAEGNDKPKAGSTIESPYETYIKTCMFYLKNRLNDQMVLELIAFFRAKAKSSSQKSGGGIRPENTSAARFFHFVSGGANLFDLSIDNNPIVFSRLIESDPFTLAYVSRIVAPTITYFGEKCSSNSHSFASMLESYTSCTGSRDNHETYPEDSFIHNDPGTQGESVAVIREKCLHQDTAILSAETAEGLLDETLMKFFQPGSDYYSIIERGALYRGLSNEFVAKKILDFITAYRPDLKGVVFWDKDNNEMVWEKGAAKAVLHKHSRLQPHERITSYDEVHTTGTDVPQVGRGVVTFGEHTRLDGFQAPWRLRGLWNGLSFTFATTESIRRAIGKPRLGYMDVIEYFVANTEPYRENENYENAPKKMFNIIRSETFDKLIYASNAYEAIGIFGALKRLFVQEIVDCPIALFKGRTVKGAPRQALKRYRDSLQKFLRGTLFTKEEKVGIDERLGKAMVGSFPRQVDVKENGGIDQSGWGQQVQICREVNEEQEQEEEVEIDNLVENQVQTDLGQDASTIDRRYWPKDLKFFNLQSWLTLDRRIPVPLHRVGDLCQSDFNVLANLIPQSLLATNNFAPILDARKNKTQFNPFLSPQQPAYQILVVQQEGRKTVVLIDQKEANLIRKHLRKEAASENAKNIGIALYDVAFDAIALQVGNGVPETDLHRCPEFNRMTALTKLLSGYSHYHDGEIEQLRESFRGLNPKLIKGMVKKILMARDIEDWAHRYYSSKLYEILMQQKYT